MSKVIEEFCQINHGVREHGSGAKAASGLLAAFEVFEDECRMPALTDLGDQNPSTAIRHPHKKSENGELTEERDTYNKVVRSVRCASERVNALLKETIAAFPKVSPDAWRIGVIVKAALVLVHLERDRSLPGGYTA